LVNFKFYKFLRQDTRIVNIKQSQQIRPVRISVGHKTTQSWCFLPFIWLYQRNSRTVVKRGYIHYASPLPSLFITYPTNQHFITYAT